MEFSTTPDFMAENEVCASTRDVKIIVNRYLTACRRTNVFGNGSGLNLLSWLYQQKAGSFANPFVVNTLGTGCLQSGILCEEEQVALLEHAPEAVEHILSFMNGGLDSGIFAYPKELAVLISELVDFEGKENSDVYYPFAEMALLAPSFRGHKLLLQEENPIMQAASYACAYVCGHDAELYPYTWEEKRPEEQFDLIISIPPFGMPGDKSFDNIMDILYSHLSPGGQMIVFVPQGYLFKRFKSRDLFIQEKAFEGIFDLPAGLLGGTNLALSVVVIEKKHHDSILMADLTSFVRSNLPYGRKRIFDVELALDALKDHYDNKRCWSLVDYADLITRDGFTQICPRHYIFRQNEAELLPKHTVTLGDIVRISRGPALKGDARLVRISDLSEDISTGPMTFQELPVISVERGGHLLENDCLLVAGIGTKLKPTLFKHTSQIRVAVKPNVWVLELIDPAYSLDYIQAELSADYLVHQCDVFRLFYGVPTIPRESFLEMRIEALPISDQMKRIKLLKEEVTKQRIAELGLELKELQDKRHDEFVKTMRVRKHAIQQVMNKLLPAMDKLVAFKDRNGGEMKGTDIVSQRTGMDVDAYMKRIQSLTRAVSVMVDGLTDERVYGEAMPNRVMTMLDEYERTRHLSSIFKLQIDRPVLGADYEVPEIEWSDGTVEKAIHISGDTVLNIWEISIDKKDFFQILDNIITNACKHGFTEDRKDYCIRIWEEDCMLGDKPAVSIHIANNGAPLQRGMTPERVFLPGEGSGDGIGAWQVKNIVEHYGGTVELLCFSPEETQFPVEYILTFENTAVITL